MRSKAAECHPRTLEAMTECWFDVGPTSPGMYYPVTDYRLGINASVLKAAK